jgi:cobalt/nickel transport system permease protein
MHFDLTDQYRPRDSFVHRRDPRAKLVVAIGFILAAGLMPIGAWGGFAALLIAALAASGASGLGLTFALRRSYVALPFALVALPLLFTIPGEVIYVTPLTGWTITAQGLERFLSLMLRSWIAVQFAILLTAVTPFPDILWSLSALRVPRLLVATIGFMYRYFFVLADESARMLRARAARSANFGGRPRPPVFWQARVAGHMVGSLFLRALERSERVHAAMVARGYDGRPPSLVRREMHLADWLTTLAACLLLVGLLAWAGIAPRIP